MNDFLTWDALSNYTTFVSIVFMIVEFTKELKGIKKVPTRMWSFIVSIVLLVLLNIVQGSFRLFDLFLYILTAMTISLGSNGLSDFNNKKN